jgi:uncharacterized protein YbjT (DUF2867 family)
LAKQNNVRSAVLLSAYGASSNSRVFYSKMKGALEDKIDSLGFVQYIVDNGKHIVALNEIFRL